MYAWYARAEVCYAYLVDVPPHDDHWASRSSFRRSVWFTRGWTLQELIAPFEVIILSQDWKAIGTKRDLVDLIQEITNINVEALLHEIPLDQYSVAQRLSWASRRETTRVEDQAYSLLGMFDIHMPTLYGEGERAFRRLQEAIMQRIPDQTLFAWWMVCDLSEVDCPPVVTISERRTRRFACSRNSQQDLSLLSRAPFDFGEVSSVVAISHNDVCRRLQLPHLPVSEYTVTPHGIRTQLPVISLSVLLSPHALSCPDNHPLPEWYLVILGCESAHHPGHLLGRICNIPPSEFGVEFVYSGMLKESERRGVYHPNLFTLSPATIELCRKHIELKTVYIAHPRNLEHQALTDAVQQRPHETIHLTFPRSARGALLSQGYTTELRGHGPNRDAFPTTHWLKLSHSTGPTITIEYEHALKDSGTHLTIGGHVTVSQSDDGLQSEAYANPSTVVWTDTSPWHLSLQSYAVDIAVSGTRVCTLHLGMKLARRSYYDLVVEVLDDVVTLAARTSALRRSLHCVKALESIASVPS